MSSLELLLGYRVGLLPCHYCYISRLVITAERLFAAAAFHCWMTCWIIWVAFFFFLELAFSPSLSPSPFPLPSSHYFREGWVSILTWLFFICLFSQVTEPRLPARHCLESFLLPCLLCRAAIIAGFQAFSEATVILTFIALHAIFIVYFLGL